MSLIMMRDNRSRHSEDFLRKKLAANSDKRCNLPQHYIYATITTINNDLSTCIHRKDSVQKNNLPIITFHRNANLFTNIQIRIINIV